MKRRFRVAIDITIEANDIEVRTESDEIVNVPYAAVVQLAQDRAHGWQDNVAPVQSAVLTALQLCLCQARL